MSKADAALAYRLEDLNGHFQPDPAKFRRVMLLQAPGLSVLHLSLAPGQRVPVHTHPGHFVLVQGLHGETTVLLDGERLVLEPQALLSFEGERPVSLGNDDAPSAVLITLVKRKEA